MNEKMKRSSSRSRYIVLLIAALLLISTASAYLLFFSDDDDNEETFIQNIGNDEYLILSGDLIPKRNVMSVEVDGSIQITVNSNDSSSNYRWVFFDNDAPASKSKTSFVRYSGDEQTTDEPVLRISDVRPGHFTISVKYNDQSGQEVECRGNIVYVGDIEKEYSWDVDSKSYSFSISFSYLDYYNCRIKDVDRSPRSNDYTGFVQDDAIISEISEKLKILNAEGSDAELANLALSFVQICIQYPPFVSDGGGSTSFIMSPDKYLTGYDNYGFYPLETLFHGMGDCEDTSILAASLFKSLGFDTALFMLPGHAMACIVMDLCVTSNNMQYPYELIKGIKEDVTYYVCETIVDVHIPIGFADCQALYHGYNTSHYMESDLDSRHGIFIVNK